MKISLQDVRIERESPSSYRVSKIYHIPTGLEIEFANALPKIEAMRRLQKSLDERSAASWDAGEHEGCGKDSERAFKTQSVT